jgi:uncharacterized hydrophobic protein (TIGR00271 family)
VIHLRIVAPERKAQATLETLERYASICNIVHLPQAARRPDGDVILVDVAREDTSMVIADLRALGLKEEGSISLVEIDSQISDAADAAIRNAEGLPSDAVVWEEVEQHTSEQVELSGVFLAFMVVAGLLAAMGIYENSAILIVGAMVVGPEFGPLAGLCVAIVQRRTALARRSARALLAGFALTIPVVYLTTLLLKAVGVFDPGFSQDGHSFANIISSPDLLSFLVAACAGVAGMLSLSTAKSGALIGVLISVTTIPAAANVGVAAAYRDWDACRGSLAQLGINLGAIVLSGVTVLWLQRIHYVRRRHKQRAERGLTPTSRATTRSRPSS